MTLTRLFIEFFDSEKSGGIILVIATLLSLLSANYLIGQGYVDFWHSYIGGLSIEHWINDGLMTIFFLMIGLELEREIYHGELSDLKSAALPVFAALGGMLVPAGIFLSLNYGTPTQSGSGIPMATDIAFAIGILSLLGNRVPASLKIFLMALAIIDDLGAILVIAIFYSSSISLLYLGLAILVMGILFIMNRLKVYKLLPYLIGGAIMWYFMLNSGVHATITGVLLAFVIPFGDGGEDSISSKLQHFLHKPVAFIILPIFALANTGILLSSDGIRGIFDVSGLGIILGLLFGKPIGIFLFSFAASAIGICTLPDDLKWKQIIGVGFLGGIGFTMSIFIALLAYDDIAIINSSKLSILAGSVLAGIAGYAILHFTLAKNESHTNND
ncbi:MAG: Na+/H+ antiporter NhaA [Candidatus Kapabacteria bacterium]|nr:Na+/H+ antiporter NhaA [Candidatus Kapabacteria bacterium]